MAKNAGSANASAQQGSKPAQRTQQPGTKGSATASGQQGSKPAQQTQQQLSSKGQAAGSGQQGSKPAQPNQRPGAQGPQPNSATRPANTGKAAAASDSHGAGGKSMRSLACT